MAKAMDLTPKRSIIGLSLHSFSLRVGMGLLSFGLCFLPAQSIAQGIVPVPSETPPASVSPASAEAPNPKAEEGKVTKTNTERKGKTATEIFLGVYLTLDKDCKIGASPKLEFPTPPQNGKIHTRNFPINLRDVPGAPRRTCIGTSPSGMAVIYRSEKKFKGEENIVFKLTYPNKDIREVSAKIIVQ